MDKMILDHRQEYLAKKFSKIASNIKPSSFFNRFFVRLSKKNAYQGIYLHGSVGRGKTMLMKKFYDAVDVPKKWFIINNLCKIFIKKCITYRIKQLTK